jgi:3-oxo-5alpha-steroid 4-dehydrogenase
VLHLDGTTIGGLYAAGRTTSGVCSFGYASGLSIGDSTFFGRLAGKAAAAEESR